MKKEWFATWFDSPYYHQLYQNHDDNEARQAIDKLLNALELGPEDRILDLACGKGRHARYLAEKGFDVTGVDISSASIAFARQFEHDRLTFFQHDMRKPFRIRYFDAIVNFFTSFGYFENDRDHLLSLQNLAKGLKPGGLFLLDYFNAEWVRQHLIRVEVKVIDGIEFHLARWIDEGYVFKSVDFQVEGQPYHFRERVRLFTLAEFQGLFSQSGLWLRQIYGGYDLRPFDLQASRRLILLAENRSL